jgi:hypothetical protein
MNNNLANIDSKKPTSKQERAKAKTKEQTP